MQSDDFEDVFFELDEFIASLVDAAELSALMETEDIVSIMNYPKVRDMLLAYSAVRKVLNKARCRAKVSCNQLSQTFGAITVEGNKIEIEDLDLFSVAAGYADNTEVYPLTNGNVRMAFGFSNLFVQMQM